ncbi:MAG: glycosyltransferase family 2 protein [Prolixibacteraceae bacterium]
MNDFPLVSIISVNYNQTQVTCEFLESLQKISYPNFEVIIVDNDSPTDSPDEISLRYPFVKLIKLKKNIGFAGGNNMGIRAAKGELILFINNDTEVEINFLQPLVQQLQRDPSIGMISPKIRFFHTPNTIQYAGYTPMNPYTMRQNLIGYRQVDKGQYDEPGTTFAIHGAAMMVPLRVIKEVGLMAEIFFLYYEEHDWCERIKKAGYKIFYEPKSLVYHKESISTGKESPLKIYYISRNRIVFARRNSKGIVLLINFLYFNFITFPKFTLQYIIQRRMDLLMPLFRSLVWNLSHYEGIKENQKL